MRGWSLFILDCHYTIQEDHVWLNGDSGYDVDGRLNINLQRS